MQSMHLSVSNLRAAATRATTASAFALGLCVSVAATAVEPAVKEAPAGSSWGLGIGVLSGQKPYAGIDRENKALPLIYFENAYVRVFGPVAEFKLPNFDISNSQRVEFRLMAKYDGSGYDADDAPILNGMSERKGGFWVGAKVKWGTDVVDVGAEWMTDASSYSKGQRFSLGLEKTWRFGQHVMLTPRLGATWLDKKHVDYYFGVRSDEVRVGRAAYEGKSAVNAELGVRGNYIFDARNSVFLDAAVTGLAKEIKNSPLVNRSNESRVLLGYLYRF